MAQQVTQPRENAFNPQSPHSSPGGDDSYNHEGTPDTRLTAFSPDENSARSTKFSKPLGRYTSEPQPVRFSAAYGNGYNQGSVLADKDPFTSTSAPGKPEQKLSATASAFHPFPSPLIARGSAAIVPISNALSPPGANQNVQSAIKRLSADIGLSRYLVITSTIQSIFPADVEVFLMTLAQRGFIYHGKRQVHGHSGKIYVQFTDIRDASMVHDSDQKGGMGWRIDYVRSDICHFVDPGFPADAAKEGLVFLDGLVGPSLGQPTAHVGSALYSLLQAEADIFAFIPQETHSRSAMFHALVEFCDVEASVAIVNRFNNFTADGIKLSLTLCKQYPDPSQFDNSGGLQGFMPPSPIQEVSNLLQGMAMVHTPQLARGHITTNHPTPSPLGPNVQPQLSMFPVVYQGSFSPVPQYGVDPVPGRHMSMVPLTNLPFFGSMYHSFNHTGLVPIQGTYPGGRPMPNLHRFDARRQNAMRVNRSPYYNGAGHHNHVDINRIREGTDVRTTIMLRNIPNKVDQAMLKRIVDESSWGKYDFMYLRIDFANDCNVGYAFINFVDPLDIIDFVNARGNQRWNCFRSDKIAEISYATIQGKDCLVQKFRNSSVMLEAPHYRPKLYFTSNGPAPELAGQEEPFPEPDNQSKMKRSCENAEHVGLFTPNAGQHFRDEQRRRRSQYDRGTRLAALEEFDYDASIQHYMGQ